jgi:hypothetical protein
VRGEGGSGWVQSDLIRSDIYIIYLFRVKPEYRISSPTYATTADPGVLCCRTLGATRCCGGSAAKSFSGFLEGATGHGRLAGAAVAGRARRELCAAIATAPLAIPRGGVGTTRHAAGCGVPSLPSLLSLFAAATHRRAAAA